MDWTEFDNKLDNEIMDQLNKLETGESTGDFEEVPVGKYEVVPEKIELTTSKSGAPMSVVWLRIVEGPFRNSMLFNYMTMKEKFGIHRAKEFIKKLEPSSPVKFESFTQWDIYLKGVAEEICCQASYVLDYGETKVKNGNVYKNFKIIDGPFEVPPTYEPPKPKDDGWDKDAGLGGSSGYPDEQMY